MTRVNHREDLSPAAAPNIEFVPCSRHLFGPTG